MKIVEPSVTLIARPEIVGFAIEDYLTEIGASKKWMDDRIGVENGEILIEFMARLCYRSFEPQLNKNVTKIHEDRQDYFENILKSRHGSVLAHAHFSFVFHNVSRVFTHEIVRHSAGTDISQESLRFVRLDDISFWWPLWAKDDPELYDRGVDLIEKMEQFQLWMAQHFNLDTCTSCNEVEKHWLHTGDADRVLSNLELAQRHLFKPSPFHEKKSKTSFMRRFAPEGLATSIGMTFNVRALRHVIEMRYSESAEEEMSVVMPQLFEIMRTELPLLFNDYTIVANSATTPYRKV